MKLTRTAIIAFCAMMAISGCGGPKSGAQKLVKEFLKENLADPNYKNIYFSDLDSTFYVTDSIVQVMRTNADTSTVFKKNIKWAEGPIARKKHFLHVGYKIGDKKVKQTFYFDDSLTRVISFKID